MKRIIFFLIIFSLLSACSLADDNEETYGETQDSWEVDPDFKAEDDMSMVGKKGRMGYIKLNGDTEKPFISGEGALYLWRFWGDTHNFKGDLVLKGVKNTGEQVELGKADEGTFNKLKSSQRGIETSLKLAFPSDGLWKIKAFFGEKEFESITVKVSENR